MGLILLFNVEKNKRTQIFKMAKTLGHTVKSISKTDYNKTLGALVGIGASSSKTSYSGPELTGEMMIFSGVNSDKLDQFLDEYKKTGIEPIALKAVMTPTNMSWTAVSLYQELTKEHNSFK